MRPLLILAGTTKAGTTSVFLYLADHPDVCASNVKETRFFLDPDYPLPAKYHLEDGLDKYQVYFNQCAKERLWLEATPDYLYGQGTPNRIRRSLQDVKLLFILRDPIERLISWYRFAKQTGRLEEQVSFAEYAARQFEMLRTQPTWEQAPQHWRALEQGRYAHYLGRYTELFGESETCIMRYETLRAEPRAFMQALCAYAQLDASFYDDYQFEVFNQSRTIKHAWSNQAYLQLRGQIRLRTHGMPRAKAFLGKMRRRFEPIILNFSSTTGERIEIEPDLRQRLMDYYADYYTADLKAQSGD